MSNAIQVDTVSTFATLVLMKEPVHHSKADARPSICELKPLNSIPVRNCPEPKGQSGQDSVICC